MALLSGIALCPELLGLHGGHSKSCDLVSRPPCLFFLVSGEPSLSWFPHVGSAYTVLLHPSLAGTLSAPSAGILLPMTLAGTFTAEWVSSPGAPLRLPLHMRSCNLLYGHNYDLGSSGPWLSTTSLDYPNTRNVTISSAGSPVGPEHSTTDT